MTVCANCRMQVPEMSYCDQCGRPLSVPQYYIDPLAAGGIVIAGAGLIYQVARDYSKRRKCVCCGKSKGFKHIVALGSDRNWHYCDACKECGGLNPYVP